MTPPSQVLTYKVDKQQEFIKFKSRLAADLGYRYKRIKLWALVTRQNGALRPNMVVPEDIPRLSESRSPLFPLLWSFFVGGDNVFRHQAMGFVRDMAFETHDLKLYLEVFDQDQRPASLHFKWPWIKIWVKCFDPTLQTLVGVGPFSVEAHQQVSDIIPMIKWRMGFAKSKKLELFEVLLLAFYVLASDTD